ncbi:MAG: hypothetical protein L6R37_006893 [Teloschistes peruensis]|nr:MAG: hypothetical protein L6R37_006893 [Teloschistes peruensis]
MATSKIGHTLAKGLGIKLNYRNPQGTDAISRGESLYSVSSADSFLEEEPTTWEWIQSVTPSGPGMLRWAYNLFPFTHWIGHYNLQWLYGDLVAGITVGAVVVPQSMAYAKLAELAPQFGLYSSFMGVLIYWFFATSKDITIGPVAVMSTITGNVVNKAHDTNPDIPAHVIASALAIVAGAIICFIGLVRLGRIVDFISLAAISAFMTGSAINISVGQVPALMGITGFSNRESTYKVVINILKHLGRSKNDAAMGLTALFFLYLVRSLCNLGARRMPQRAKMFFFLSTLRTAFTILLYTLISWLVNRHHRSQKLRKFAILGTVPRGFQNAAVPTINSSIIKTFASEIPASIIVLLIEHIAIAKSFGRVNNYTIDPSQEMVAIGVTNLLGPFLGAYPATGSFSRTAIKSKAGVRTPFAGVITAIVVLLAIYALPAVFFYIPNSVLSAVIIHAVGDLITPPNTIYQFWRVNPLEVIIFFAGVFVTIFSSIENGIYTTICISVAVLLFRVLFAQGRFVGKVKVHSVVGDHIIEETGKFRDKPFDAQDPDKAARNIFLPFEHGDGSNPQIKPQSPYPGIFIYRFSEGYNYPNANRYLDHMVATIFKQTRRTNAQSFPRLGDRPWNDPGPRRGRIEEHSDKPTLKAIILDFSSVNNVDITSVQHLIDVRNQLDRYASPDKVDWHLACINNRWTKRALASAGFGFPTPVNDGNMMERWKPIFSVAELGGQDSAAAAAQYRENARRVKDVEGRKASRDTDTVGQDESASSDSNEFVQTIVDSKAYGGGVTSRVVVVHGLNRPLFHIDLTSALQSAIANVERIGEYEAKGVGTPAP